MNARRWTLGLLCALSLSLMGQSGLQGGADLTVQEQDGSPVYRNINVIQVDQADGLTLTQPAARTVLVNSTGGGGSVTTLTDDAGCNGLDVIRRNVGDTAFECAPSAGGGLTHPQVMARTAVGF